MSIDQAIATLPRALSSYPDRSAGPLIAQLVERVRLEPFNAVATGIFILAILHTFAAAIFARHAVNLQQAHDERSRAAGRLPRPSVRAELLHFMGEVQVVFGLWAIALLVAMVAYVGWEASTHYFNDAVNYTEPLFVVVIMALASTRPTISLAESMLGRLARLGGSSPAAWWVGNLTVGPPLGSFITEPGAMTICAVLLARQFYDRQPGTRLKYATLGLLFVNVSIGGTLTHFAAPPVLMVARLWNWDLPFMLSHFGWRAAVAITASTLVYWLIFRRELRDLTPAPVESGGLKPAGYDDKLLPVPAWLTVVHIGF